MNNIKLALFFLLLGLNGVAFAECCCEPQIKQKTQMVDLYLQNKNKINEQALEALNKQIKDLNENIYPNRTTEIKDSILKQELNKFKLNAKNLYHANSIPSGLLYYQLMKNAHDKELIIDSVSTHTDLIILNSKTNIESLKTSIYNNAIKQNINIEEEVQEVFKK